MQWLTTEWPANQWLTRRAQKAVTVRAIHPRDAEMIEKMHQRLTPESIYYRYLHPRAPTPAEIAAVCQLDQAKGAGLVATVAGMTGHGGARPAAERIVGVAYYVREAVAGPPTAEPGILVEDQFQGQGIGRALWQRLQQRAGHDQIRYLHVLSHPGNQRVQGLIQGGGLPYQATINGGLSEYLVILGDYPQPSRAQRVLGKLGLARFSPN